MFKTETMIEGFIFDLGKVIIDYSLENTVGHWVENTDKDIQWYIDNFPQNGTFEQFERGELSWREFLDAWTSNARFSMSPQVFLDGWNNIFLDVYDGIDELLDDLRERYPVVALSNTNELHVSKWTAAFGGTINKFDKIFASNEIGARKPEKRAYDIVLEHLQLAPDSVVFFDDLPENIAAARELGIKGYQVEGAEQIKSVLKDLEII